MGEFSDGPRDTTALAQKLGISRWAVSRALNHQPGVGANTRARVLAALANGDFEPNAHARGLRGTGVGTVGLSLPSFRDPIWTPLAAGLCEGLVIRGLQPDWMLGTGGPEGEGRIWTRYAARHVAAVLVLGAGTVPVLTGPEAPASWRELERRKVPVIFVDPAWTEEPDGLCVVRSDDHAAAALVAGHLQSHGHRHVGLCGFGVREEIRAQSLRTACEARGLSCSTVTSIRPFSSRRNLNGGVMPGRYRPASTLDPTGSRRSSLPAKATAPTALVAADDLRALKALCDLRADGRTVPGEVSLVGYGDEPAGALAAPALTTLDPQRSQLLARTLELLDELLQEPGSVQAGSVWIPPLLRCRASVSKLGVPPVESGFGLRVAPGL